VSNILLHYIKSALRRPPVEIIFTVFYAETAATLLQRLTATSLATLFLNVPSVSFCNSFYIQNEAPNCFISGNMGSTTASRDLRLVLYVEMWHHPSASADHFIQYHRETITGRRLPRISQYVSKATRTCETVAAVLILTTRTDQSIHINSVAKRPSSQPRLSALSKLLNLSILDLKN